MIHICVRCGGLYEDTPDGPRCSMCGQLIPLLTAGGQRPSLAYLDALLTYWPRDIEPGPPDLE